MTANISEFPLLSRKKDRQRERERERGNTSPGIITVHRNKHASPKQQGGVRRATSGQSFVPARITSVTASAPRQVRHLAADIYEQLRQASTRMPRCSPARPVTSLAARMLRNILTLLVSRNSGREVVLAIRILRLSLREGSGRAAFRTKGFPRAEELRNSRSAFEV